MVDRSNGGGQPSDDDYQPGKEQFGDEDSGGLAAEPGDETGSGVQDAQSEFSDLAGTPTGDLGAAGAEDIEQDRDIDRDIGGEVDTDR
jgi:hypothetical protein